MVCVSLNHRQEWQVKCSLGLQLGFWDCSLLTSVINGCQKADGSNLWFGHFFQERAR